jgi:hypothetical protein
MRIKIKHDSAFNNAAGIASDETLYHNALHSWTAYLLLRFLLVSLPVVVVVPLLFMFVAPLLLVPPFIVEAAFIVSIPLVPAPLAPLAGGSTFTTVSFWIPFLVLLSVQLNMNKANPPKKSTRLIK